MAEVEWLDALASHSGIYRIVSALLFAVQDTKFIRFSSDNLFPTSLHRIHHTVVGIQSGDFRGVMVQGPWIDSDSDFPARQLPYHGKERSPNATFYALHTLKTRLYTEAGRPLSTLYHTAHMPICPRTSGMWSKGSARL